MSSSDRHLNAFLLRGLMLGAGLLALASLSACTVRPLYSNAALTDSGQTASTGQLASISIKPVETRYAQEVRNHLIFLLNGGAGQSAGALYTLNLGVTVYNTNVAEVQVVTEDRPTAGSVTMTSSYVLTENATGKTVASGSRNVSSSYDRPSQEFAALRAKRDAEDRAARELAELLRLAIGQDMAKL